MRTLRCSIRSFALAPRILTLLAVVVSGCPSPTHLPADPPHEIVTECLQLDATPTVADSLPITLTLRSPAVKPPPPHGGLALDGTWTANRPLHGLRSGTAAFVWEDGSPLHIDLQPMPADVGVQFVVRPEVGGGVITRWSGVWLSVSEGASDTTGTVVLARLPADARCDAPELR